MYKNTATYVIIIQFLFAFFACQQTPPGALSTQGNAVYLFDLNERLHETIIHDGFNPPVASRIYNYCNLAAYEVVCLADTSPKSFTGVYNGFEMPKIEGIDQPWDINVALLAAFAKTSGKVTYRPYIIENYRDSVFSILKPKMEETVYSNSVNIGEQVGAAIVAYAMTDMYVETRNMSNFEPTGVLGNWEPTPPKYIDAIEPHWMRIRPAFLTRSDQVKCADRIPFDTARGSAMYEAAIAVYNAVNDTVNENKEIAAFWDCNPQKTNVKGHMMITVRQLTPGGHWVNIALQACERENLGLAKSSYILAVVSATVFDAFINCWHEKYRTDVIRPETYINRYIDPSWKPLLETPVFPEHPSGHSVVSGSASTVLTRFFGSDYAFVDSTEVTFGNGVRQYKSFAHAAEEATMSRLYGGIHYRLACDDGLRMGKEIGNYVLEKVNPKPVTVSSR